MRILAVGDVVGNTGRTALKDLLLNFKKENNIDFIIANVENASGGMGLTRKGYDDLNCLEIDVMTMGNHTWAKRDIFNFIDDVNNLIRPANYSNEMPGVGYVVLNKKNKNILVISLIGRTGIEIKSDCPFLKCTKIIDKVKSETKIDITIVDFHAETTAEKIAMGYYLKDDATIVFGTHTHVQTADEKIFDTGMGYISDIGMTGPKESVIGLEVDIALKRFLTQLPEKYSCAEGEYVFNGVVFDVDDSSNKVTKITRINK